MILQKQSRGAPPESTEKSSMFEWDIWADAFGKLRAVIATQAIVTDHDAPIGFVCHEIRLNAASARSALKICRAKLRTK